ncbi:glycosyltransferase [Bacillus sp. B15-48]|uniref:glycosyltransferase n=1 Tax=Bacillus sp. B15-48 TaxID=1548601 RepID=UPI00193ED12D|nr:glycosyltransferase [Bacillus sp. B15-48]
MELKQLCETFNKVYIIPVNVNDYSKKRQLPDNVEVHLPFEPTKKTGVMKKILSLNETQGRSWFFDELPTARNYGLKGVGKLLSWITNALIIRDYIEKNIISERNSKEFVAYSYWLSLAPGISFLKERYPNLKVYSRGHGGDIYDERHDPPYLPVKRRMLTVLDEIFLVSTYGKDYLVNEFPETKDKLTVSRLGTLKPAKSTEASTDGITRLVSCSYMVPIKRLSLLVEALQHSKTNLHWTHIGDGPERENIEKLVQKLPGNVTVHFTGSLKNEDVMKYYMQNPVDYFINVSASEGIPVSIMEAFSCCIPAIATDVGGTSELVNSQNGVLVPEDITSLELASILDKVGTSSLEEKAKMRESAFQTWDTLYNAEKNYSKFVREISS